MSMSTPVESPSVARPRKVLVVFKNAGDAPPLKQKKFKIKGEEKFAAVIAFLRGQLNRETLFLYIDSKFSPTPDENIGDMFENFGTKGMLIVNYAFSMAWG